MSLSDSPRFHRFHSSTFSLADILDDGATQDPCAVIVHRVRMERDVLKKAAAFFARDHL